MPEEQTKEVLEFQVPTTLKCLIEALIFAAREPLSVKQLKDIYEGEGAQAFLRHLEVEEIHAAINDLNEEYEREDRPYRIIQIAGGYQFATISSYADWIGRLYREQARRKLSQSGIETLAIVAYKQPVTKSDIENIRGVNCDYVLKTLLEKELVTIVGRAHAPGRPLLYGTTREFLQHFGLNEITDLPRPREIEEILGESQFETERRMLESQAGAEKAKEEEPDFKSRLPHIPRKKSELERTVEIKSKTSQKEIRTIETAGNKAAEQEMTSAGAIPPVMTVDVSGAVREGVDEHSSKMLSDSPVQQAPSEVVPEDQPQLIVDGISRGNTGGSNDAIVQGVIETPLPEHTSETEMRTDPPVESEHSLLLGSAAESREQFPSANDVEQVSLPSVPQKTKWQSWKEKVQGFIKKIFG